MKKNQLIHRRDKILEILMGQEEVPVKQLISALGVSDETIRKDLIEMERQDLINRRHGKVALVSRYVDETMPVRARLNQSAKERIAMEAIRHIPVTEIDFIGLDVGNTTWNIAKLLVKAQRPTVVTNSLEISSLYAAEGNSNIYCAGGILRSSDLGFYGYWTIHNLKTINMSVALLGTAGIMDRDGLGAISFDDRDIKQLYARNSQYRIAVFDSTKCTHGALVDGVSWDDIDLVITDEGIPDADRERIERRTKLIVV